MDPFVLIAAWLGWLAALFNPSQPPLRRPIGKRHETLIDMGASQ